MICEDELQTVRTAQRHPLAGDYVVLSDGRRACRIDHIVDSATEEQRDRAIRVDLLDPIAIPVVDEGPGIGPVGDGRQAVLRVEALRPGDASFDALGHVAVGVVRVAVGFFTALDGGDGVRLRAFVGVLSA